MGRGMTKAERLQEMERLYFQHAFSDSEIAERLGIDRTTAFRDRTELETKIPFSEVEKGRWKIDRSKYLSEIRVNLTEALALYLSARRSSQQTHMAQLHTASALEKLALALRQPMTDRLVKAAEKIMKQNAQPERAKILETIARGWVDGVKIRLKYQGLHGHRVWNYVISPYLIEPTPWSDATYLIGYSDVHGEIAVFKVERIEDATLTNDHFEIPADFDESRLLQYAWGVWFGEGKPETVTLRFMPGPATRRLKESIWHPTQKITDLEDGGSLWQAQVAEWQEMLPWIRGWGADVEVLEPERLRSRLVGEIQRLGRLYNLESSDQIPLSFHLWAKTEGSYTHPLIYHMLDAGECTLALWKFGLSEHTRKLFKQYLNLDSESAGRTLAFWAALHDMGKAGPGFQRKYPATIPALKKAGYTFPDESPHPAPHGILTAWALPGLLSQETGMRPREAKQLAYALAGHHGAWPTIDSMNIPALQRSDKGEGQWDSARKELFIAVKEVYNPIEAVHLPGEQSELNAFLSLFSGLVSVADWIASIEDYFPFLEEYLTPAQYVGQIAQAQAKTVLQQLGWIGWHADGSHLSFSEMFSHTHIAEPNPIQLKAIEAAESCALPVLIILEAPTGIGKTEAALYLADTWLQTQQGKGIYIAMPTQATSNQMYGRVVDFLKSRYPAQVINAHLVHSGVISENKHVAPSLSGIAQDQQDEERGVKAETWFLPRKRTLLAPFGVGTVDQALMSVLQTRHFFVRMFGLGQKIVIFDEVHAYDTYMSTLFQRLLGWLRRLETSVILLSATLPEKTRQQLVEAWMGEKTGEMSAAEYPRLTMVTNNTVEVFSLPAPEKRTLKINWVEPHPEAIAEHLADKLADGGCAVVICNRVKRAQEVYTAIQASGIVDDENLILFHARFPFAWREEIEKRVLGMFSKTGLRPRKAILVATQVVEQSLDLDFDYLITDLAPVDLLLQRAGRLHRHPKNDELRPQKLQQPQMATSRTKMVNGIPDFGQDVYVYDHATLLRTWLTMRDREQIMLPEQTSWLIEMVYGDGLENSGLDSLYKSVIQAVDEEARLSREHEMHQAYQRMVALPDYEDYLTARNEGLEEDDPRINDAFRALTRMAEPSVSLICLHQTQSGVALSPDGTVAFDLTQCPTLEQARELLHQAVSVSRREVVNYFVNQVQLPENWRKSALVRYHYPIVFDHNGECHLDGAKFTLILTHDLGLDVIRKAAS